MKLLVMAVLVIAPLSLVNATLSTKDNKAVQRSGVKAGEAISCRKAGGTGSSADQIMNENEADKLLLDKFTPGGKASVAADLGGCSDGSDRWSRSQSLFAGVALDATLRQSGQPLPSSADALIKILNKYSVRLT